MHLGVHYEKAPQQPVDIKVFKSIERPELTRVFGTSTPPTGLSGRIRKQAFKYSEAKAAHWMGLLLADRVNVVEGIISDIRHGIFPNFVEELGWRAEWQHNRKQFVGRMAVKAIVIVAITIWLTRKSAYCLRGCALQAQPLKRYPEIFTHALRVCGIFYVYLHTINLSFCNNQQSIHE